MEDRKLLDEYAVRKTTAINKLEVLYVVSRCHYKTNDVIDRGIVYLEENSRQVYFGCRYFEFTLDKFIYKDLSCSIEFLISRAVTFLHYANLMYNFSISRAFKYTDSNGKTRIFGLLAKNEDNECREYLVEFSLNGMIEKEYPKTVNVFSYLNLEETKKILEKLLELNEI